MAKIKNHTNLEESKILEKILPLESADMCYSNDGTAIKIDANPYLVRKKMWQNIEVIPCWSLAALLEIIKKPTAFDLLINGRGYRCHCTDKYEGKFHGTEDYCDNAIDACVEINIKLNEQKIL